MAVTKAGLAVDVPMPNTLPEAVLLDITHPLTPTPLNIMAPIPVAVQMLVGDDAWAPLGARGREITGPDAVMVPLGFTF